MFNIFDIFGRRKRKKERKKEKKEEKKQQEMKEIMDKYGFDELNPHDLESIKRINNSLLGLGLIETGMALSFSLKSEDQAKIGYLSALVEQNWVIIRLLNEINNKLNE